MSKSADDFGPGWVYPVVDYVSPVNGALYPAVVSDGMGSPRDGGARRHAGVDICFRRKSPTDLVKEFPPGTRSGTAGYFAPPTAQVVAARDGVLWSAGLTSRGWTVVIDHGKPWATYYTHMASLAVPLAANGRLTSAGDKRQYTVRAGQLLGFMGADPTGTAIRHLHFATWRNGSGDAAAVDPEQAMRSWPHLRAPLKLT